MGSPWFAAQGPSRSQEPPENQAGLEPASFWSRARVAFYSAIVNQKHGELLHSEGSVSEDTPEEAGGAENAHDETPPEPQRVGEEVEYSQSMHDTWLQFLHEEITLLKVERQNESLIQAQGTSPGRKPQPPKRAPWADLPSASPPPKATGSLVKPPPSFSRVVSVRTIHSRPPRPASDELPRGTQPLVLRKRGPLIRSGSLTALVISQAGNSGLIDFGGSVSAKDLGAEEVSEGQLEMRTRGGRRQRAKSGLPGGLERLAEEPPRAKAPASSAQRRAQRAVLERKESGISAATAAAEAAHVGGKRIRSMWSKMKTALGSRSKDKSGPRKPDMDALSSAVRAGELPPEKRGAAWLALALQDAQDIVDAKRRYASFVALKLDQDSEIKRDIHRTFPEHPLFQEEDGPGQKALLNVMKAYAAYDPEVGYCQGMAFLAAVFLMHMGEEDAFAVLIHTTYRCGFRATFLPDMDQLQARLYQLTQLVQEALPQLDAHMEELGIRPVMYAAPWFLTAFASTLPLPLVFRVLDVILAERSSAMIFRTALVLLQVSLRQLLQCSEAEHFVHFVRRELSLQLETLAPGDLEEIPAKALRVDLPFDSMLRLEAEYELLAEEAATAANEIDAAAAASQAAAEAWEKARAELETRLAFALQAQARAEAQLASLLQLKDVPMDQISSNSESGFFADSTSVLEGPVTPFSNYHGLEPSTPAGHIPRLSRRPSSDAPDAGEDSDDETVQERHVPSVVLLRRVGTLRHERQRIDGSLKKAEKALQEAVRIENKRLAIERNGGVASVGRATHLRRASWAASPAQLQSE